MRKVLPLLFFLFPLFGDEVTVDLKNPVYKNGILYTTQGGVIKNQDIRIQAKTIQYVKRQEGGKEVHRLEAEGNLLIQYKGRAYVGSELEYDFVEKSGTVYDGKTFSSLWYIGGDKIDLKPDGSYKVSNAFVTTCENKDSTWDLHANNINVFKRGELLEAQKVRFRLFKIPFLWLPSIKLNMKKFKEPFFRYKFDWDKGPLFGARYQLYSWRDFALYGRLEYRWSAGWGGALETEYFPPDKRTSFVTKSYVGTNRLQNAPGKKFRFRVQGALDSITANGKTQTAITWDKYSDVRMPSDFKSLDFEVNTAKKTLFYVHHTENQILGYLKARPRVNSFETVSQDLPTLYTALRPAVIGKTGLLSFFDAKASYLSFDYSDQLVEKIKDFSSGRFEIKEKLARPIHLGPLTLTPYAGIYGIFYTNSQNHHSKSLAVASYGADLNMKARRNFQNYKHIIEPYFSFSSLTHPTVSPDNHYIFSIQDGYNHINQFQAGIRSVLFSKRRPNSQASFTADLFVNAFTSDPTIPQFIPKLYLNLDWRLPSITLSMNNAWNFRHQVLDHSNTRFLWTINENVALALEARYRSQYDWRKADHQNFILDVTRFESDLLLSPLSDRRITLLTHLFIRFTPLWECHLQSHSGLYRLDQKPYNEIKVDLFTWISAACKIRLSLTRVAKFNKIRPSVGLSFYK